MLKYFQQAEEAESPKRNIRDSGYIDCWDSERSDSLSPPRHCREDSFDSLDSFGSRSRQTPSPDVLVARGSSDGMTHLHIKHLRIFMHFKMGRMCVLHTFLAATVLTSEEVLIQHWLYCSIVL